MLLSYSAERTLSRSRAVDHRVIRLPRKSLSPLVHHIDDAVLLRPIPRGTGTLSLLRHSVDAVLAIPDSPRRTCVNWSATSFRASGPHRGTHPRCSNDCRRAWHTRGATGRHQDRYRGSPPQQRAVNRWRRTAAQDIGKLHPQAVRKRRHNVFAIRAKSATGGAPIAC
jgi:hypothetical protein